MVSLFLGNLCRLSRSPARFGLLAAGLILAFAGNVVRTSAPIRHRGSRGHRRGFIHGTIPPASASSVSVLPARGCLAALVAQARAASRRREISDSPQSNPSPSSGHHSSWSLILFPPLPRSQPSSFWYRITTSPPLLPHSSFHFMAGAARGGVPPGADSGFRPANPTFLQ